MIVSKLVGGLGNQMFQYAIAKAMAKKHNTSFSLDISEFRVYKVHGYSLSVFDNIDCDINGNKYQINLTPVRETTDTFDKNVFNMNNVYLQGYWQSPKYFENIKDKIINDFTYTLDNKFSSILKVMNDSNSVAVHFRRKDYLRQDVMDVLGICSNNYYDKAISIIKEKIPELTFFIFSDDIQWVKNNLPQSIKNNNHIFIEDNSPSDDIMLMSKCKNQIIANSTFSWWASYLNKNQNKVVIAPTPWYNNKTKDGSELYLNGWITICK